MYVQARRRFDLSGSSRYAVFIGSGIDMDDFE
jgi:hypothetical protein